MKPLQRLPELKKRERPFESQLRDILSRQGVMFVKLKPTVIGWPDRVAIAPPHTQNPRVIFVECKTQDGKLSAAQSLIQRDLTDRGVAVVTVQGPSAAKAAKRIMAMFVPRS